MSANPAVTDFAVTQKIDSGEASNVTPSVTSLDATGKIVTLTVPAVVATTADQSVVNSVSYKGGAAVAASAFTVAKVDFTVSSVSAITATTVKVVLTASPATPYTTADASKFNVLAGGAANVVTTVTRDLSDESAKTYTLTLTNSLNNTEGNLTVNGTSPASKVVVGSDFDYDSKVPTVTKVEALNGSQIKITFSEKMDKTTAEDILNYSISDPSGAVITGNLKALSSNSNATLSADKLSVVITLGTTDMPTGLANSSFYFITNDGTGGAAAKDLNNNVCLKTITPFEGMATADTTGPSLSSASYNKATSVLKLTFDEPVKLNDADINELKISIAAATGTPVALAETDYTIVSAATANEITITLTTSKAAVDALTGSLTVTLAEGAFKDFAANNSVAKSVTATVATAPQIQTATYDEKTNKLTLTFDKDVNVATLTDLTKIQVKTGSGIYADLSGTSTVETTANGTSVVIVPNSPSFRGTAVVATAGLKLKANALSDVADAQANVETEVALNFVNDIVAPSVVSASYQNITHVLTLTFDEAVQAATVAKGNIKFYDANTAGAATALGDGGTSVSAVDGTTITVTIAGGDITLLDGLSSDSTKFELSAVQDITGNVMTALTKAAATGVTTTVSDLVPPQVHTDTAVVNSNLVKVVFNEKVDPATAQNKDNYEIYVTAAPAQKLTIVSATLLANGTDVQLVTSTQLSGAGYTVKAANVKDIAGNVILATNNTDTFVGSATTNTAPTISSAVFADVDNDGKVSVNDTVTLGFSEAVKFIGTVSEADFTLGTSATPTFGLNAAFATSTTDPSKVVVTLGTAPKMTVAGAGKTTIDVKTANDLGDLLDLKAAVSSAVAITGDEVAPSIAKAVITDVDNSNSLNAGDTLTVTFSEGVAATTANLVDGSSVIDSFGLTNLSAMGNATIDVIDSKNLKITFGTTTNFGTFAVGDNVAYIDASDAIYDLFGNEAGTAVKASEAVSTDGPVITSAVFYDTDANGADVGDRMILTFDRNIGNATSAAALADDFTLNTGSNLQIAAGAVSRYDNNKLAITLGTAATIAANPTINISATPGNVTLTDFYGNKAVPAASPVTVTVGTAEAAPVLSSVTYTDTHATGSIDAGDTVKYGFSKAMDKNAFNSNGSDADTLLGAQDNDFGTASSIAWNEAGTELTVTLSATSLALANGDVFNPAAGVVDVMGKADATAFAPSVEIVFAASGVTLGATTATTQGVAPVKQVETATVAGTIGAAGAGDATVTVTAAGVPALVAGKAIAVAVANDDTAALVAGKIRTALGLDADVSGFFDISGAGAEVILTAKTAAANDTTINIATIDGTSVGLTPAATSADTTAGVVAVKEVGTTTVTTGASATGTLTVNVADGALDRNVAVVVTAGDDAATVAGKIRIALAADTGAGGVANVGAGGYTVTGAGAIIILTQNAASAGSNVTLAVTLG
ncbi:MAG: hypothetical protein APF81_01995 [Desulfosporosinus sp. BRH_c37]|nr:MAG: hypothetical protein APF81_01995 [Desulfosporosinus sp. BRH_c37]